MKYRPNKGGLSAAVGEAGSRGRAARVVAAALTIVVLCLCSVCSADESGWKLFYDKGGILGYEKPVPGSPYSAYKAQCIAEAGMDVIAQVLRDVPAFPKWLTQCTSAEVLSRKDENSMLLYLYFDSPWPVSDRDAVVENTFQLDKNGASAVIGLSSRNDAGPPAKKNAVRIPSMQGKITLEYMGRDRTRISYENHSDPGGNISPSMVKMTARYYPIQYLQGICALAADPRYKEMARGSVEANNLDRFASDQARNEILLKERCTAYVQNEPVTRRVVEDPGSASRMVASGSTYQGIAGEVSRALDECLNAKGPSSVFTDQDLIKALQRTKVGPRIRKRQGEAIYFMFLSGESLEESLSRLAEGIVRDRDY
ncbi:MAG: START domain-containing protein, partial [Thermodesulfobacteriota bacterium]